MKLRPYQDEALLALRRLIGTGKKRPVLQSPTASGKTVMAGEIIKMAMKKGNRVMFICDRVELIDQTSATFDAFGIPHGVIQAQHPRTDPTELIQVASIQTLARRRWPVVDMLIVDECHVQYKTLINKLDEFEWQDKVVIGLSATPWSKGLGNLYNGHHILTTTSELIEDGFLCPFEVYAPPVDVSGVRIVRGDFDERQLEEKINTKKIVGSVVKTYQKHGRGKPALCFAVNIAHSKALCEEFNARDIGAVHLDHFTEKDERRDIIRRFKAGEIPVLCSVEVMTKGFDAPNAEILILARPTKSLILHVQMIGRVLRIKDDKPIATILDHAGNHERLGFVTDDLNKALCTKQPGEKADKDDKPVEKLPKACPKCHHLKEVGVHICPKCGFAPDVQNTVEHEAGELKRVEVVSKAVKQEWYSMLLCYGEGKKYNNPQGWAAHTYREKFGVWPRQLHKLLLPPNEEVRKYITYLNIKNAKRRNRS